MKKITRRTFLDASAKAAAGLYTGLAALSIRPGKVLGANEVVNFALIGCGGRGRYVARGLIEQGARLIYLCDLHTERIDTAANFITDVQAEKPQTTKLMQKILDDKSVDAVVVATPDHWHALCVILACQAGKDVLVEKPHCHNVWESRQMIKAARKYNRIVQVGTQNRSAPYIYKAIDYINSGKLGDIHLIKVYNMKPAKPFKPFSLGPSSTPPEGFDWNTWLGAAPERPYNESIFEDGWHHFWDFSGGDFINDGSHQLDIARMLMGNPSLPKAVSASGGKLHFKNDDSEMADVLVVNYRFEDYIITFEQANYPRYMQKTTNTIRRNDLLPYWTQNATRIELYGSEEMMILGRMGGGWVSMTSGGKVVEKQYGRFPDPYHQKNFIESVKSRKLPNADIELLHNSCCMMHMANIAYRLGNKTLSVDPVGEKFIDNPEADKLLKRRYRKEFEVPEYV